MARGLVVNILACPAPDLAQIRRIDAHTVCCQGCGLVCIGRLSRGPLRLLSGKHKRVFRKREVWPGAFSLSRRVTLQQIAHFCAKRSALLHRAEFGLFDGFVVDREGDVGHGRFPNQVNGNKTIAQFHVKA